MNGRPPIPSGFGAIGFDRLAGMVRDQSVSFVTTGGVEGGVDCVRGSSKESQKFEFPKTKDLLSYLKPASYSEIWSKTNQYGPLWQFPYEYPN